MKCRLKSLVEEIIKYLISGGFAFLADFATLYLLTEFLGLYYYVSVGLGFLVGVVIVYILNTRWVFKYRAQKNKNYEFLIFLVIAIDGLCLNLILVPFFTEIAELYYLISKVITTIIVLFWNYTARKYFLFSRKEVL